MIAYWFLIFLTFSVAGWLMEVIDASWRNKRLTNRGFLLGPYCPIYGVGAVGAVFLLERYKEDPVLLFVMAMVIFGILEYSVSWVMERIFHARWWDYSARKFNLNGRICLETIIPFGIGGVLLMYVMYPLTGGFWRGLPEHWLLIVAGVLGGWFLADLLITGKIIYNIRKKGRKMAGDVTEQVDEIVYERIKKEVRGARHILQAFPQLRFKNLLKWERARLRERARREARKK